MENLHKCTFQRFTLPELFQTATSYLEQGSVKMKGLLSFGEKKKKKKKKVFQVLASTECVRTWQLFNLPLTHGKGSQRDQQIGISHLDDGCQSSPIS